MKLLKSENLGYGIVEKTWLHTDGAGNDNFTVESAQDVEPIFEDVKRSTEMETSKDIRLIAKIPEILLEETCRVCAKHWGMSVKDAVSEVMQNKTDRAKMVWKMLTQGSEYSKLQAKTWR